MKKIVEVTIKGVCPLLQHRFPTEEQGEEKSRRKQKVFKAKDEAEKSLYKDGKGGVYEPAEHILAALAKAGTAFKFERRTTYKQIMNAGVVIEPDCIPLNKKTYDEIDSRPVVIERKRIVRSRPKFNDWGLSFRICVLDDRISIPALKEILDFAGSSIGIGDYRPRFGRFMVTKFKETDKRGVGG